MCVCVCVTSEYKERAVCSRHEGGAAVALWCCVQCIVYSYKLYRDKHYVDGVYLTSCNISDEFLAQLFTYHLSISPSPPTHYIYLLYTCYPVSALTTELPAEESKNVLVILSSIKNNLILHTQYLVLHA